MSGIAVGDHAAMTWNPACGAWDCGSGCYCPNRSKHPTSQNIEAPTFFDAHPFSIQARIARHLQSRPGELDPPGTFATRSTPMPYCAGWSPIIPAPSSMAANADSPTS
jgi:hypothetical protein